MWLFPDSREWGLGTREPRAGSRDWGLRNWGIKNRKPEANSRKPGAENRDSGVETVRLWSRESRANSRQQEAGSRQPTARSLHCPTYSLSQNLNVSFSPSHFWSFSLRFNGILRNNKKPDVIKKNGTATRVKH